MLDSTTKVNFTISDIQEGVLLGALPSDEGSKSEVIQDYILVEKFSLAEFLKEIQFYVQKGYEIDFSTNEGYPSSYTSYYNCSMKLVTKQDKKSSQKKTKGA